MQIFAEHMHDLQAALMVLSQELQQIVALDIGNLGRSYGLRRELMGFAGQHLAQAKCCARTSQVETQMALHLSIQPQAHLTFFDQIDA